MFTSCNQLLYGTVCFLFFHQCTPLPLTRFRAALRNPGDRHGLFRFAVPSLFLGRVLGPETYGWLVERYGQASVDRGDIRRAPTDNHQCGRSGWCRESCLPVETRNWTLKDLCGVFHCCTVIPTGTPLLDNHTIGQNVTVEQWIRGRHS